MTLVRSLRRILTISIVLLAALVGGTGSALLGICGPFTDVSDAAFCPFVLEIFYLGLTTGTTPTTYSPDESATWDQGYSSPYGIIFDGVNIWVADITTGLFYRLNSAAAILQTVTVGSGVGWPVFDGQNIWLPSTQNQVVVSGLRRARCWRLSPATDWMGRPTPRLTESASS
jgi:hypothetical protein